MTSGCQERVYKYTHNFLHTCNRQCRMTKGISGNNVRPNRPYLQYYHHTSKTLPYLRFYGVIYIWYDRSFLDLNDQMSAYNVKIGKHNHVSTFFNNSRRCRETLFSHFAEIHVFLNYPTIYANILAMDTPIRKVSQLTRKSKSVLSHDVLLNSSKNSPLKSMV